MRQEAWTTSYHRGRRSSGQFVRGRHLLEGARALADHALHFSLLRCRPERHMSRRVHIGKVMNK